MEVWEPFKKVIKYWESLSKSKRPSNKSYECLQRHYTDLLIPAKLQFFAFIAGIFEPYLVIFQTDMPMVPFMFAELKKIFDKLHRLVFRQESLAASITDKLKKKWLSNTEHHLENGLVDLGAATKKLLNDVMVSAEKKRKFQGQCKQMVLDILLKLSERSPLRYTIVRSASCLSPANMINSPKECSQRFTILANRLFDLKKISASVADNSKYQFDQFLKVAQYDQKEQFQKFSFKKDRLDIFFAQFLAENDSYNNLWTICKIIFILSHGQSFTERGFSINREVIDHNMQGESLTSQRLVYDSIHSGGSQLSDFQITPALRKSCLLSYQKYKLEQKKAEEKESNSADLKRKLKHDEIQKVKKQKLDLEATIKVLRDAIIKETLLADDNQDLSYTAKAAAFCRSLKQKKESLAVLTTAQEHLEGEYKDLLLK